MPSKRNQRTVTQKPSPKPTVTSRSRSQDAGKIARHSSRRSSKTEVELLMECVDDELSPAQLKAIELAQQEHEKANNLIKAARAGNTLVPSSQPNTFTIVPATPKQALPQPQPPAPVQAQVPVKPAKNVVASPPAAQQRGLPPPRPPQFMNKQGAATTSADVIVIGETPARALSKPVSLPQQPSVPVMQGTNVTPKQVYKFVSLPGNQPAQLATNQWVIRPIMTVPPQQQGLITSSTMTQSGLAPSLMQFTNIVPQGVLATSLSQPVTQSPVTTKSSSQPVPVQSVGRVKSSDTNKPKAAETPGGLKRTASDADLGGAPASKKKTPTREKGLRETDSSGNWVPLDEYYYGTMEGDKAYTEEKNEFRFKCWYCSKMLYNNIRAMQHIQGHIDSSKQQNIDLSDLTQCKHCYKQFDTPFEMQTHVEKVHLSNKVLMCRICEKDMSSQRDLTQHMRQNHKAYEMPYVCQLCNFKSSMYSDVVDHFKKKHDSSNSLLCLYCLRTFDVKFVSQGWGQTQTYYGHLLKHQSKSSAKKCVVCRLTFFNANDVKNHRKNHHVSNHKGVHGVPAGGKFSSQDPVMIKVADSSNMPQKTGSSTSLKSLNAPSVSKMQDYGDVKFPGETKTASCFECKMTMSSTDHYKKYINCSMCRFATSCSVAYANHMMGFHSGQMTSLNLNIPWERPMSTIMYCSCGFSTKYGNKIANHLVSCSKSTCFYNKPDQSVAGTGASTTPGITEDDGKESDGSLLGVLGLVQKRTVTTRGGHTGGIRTSSVDAEPLESKSDMPDVKKKRGGSRPGPKSKRGRSRTVSPAPAKALKSSKPDKTFKEETSKAKDEEKVVELVEETAEKQTEPIKNKSDVSSKQDMESVTEDGKQKDQSDEMEVESAIREDGKGSGVIDINKIDNLDEKFVAASNIKSGKDHPAVDQTDTTLKTNMSEESISASIGSNIQGPAVVASGSSDNIDDKDSDSKKNSSELDKGAASEKFEESKPIKMDDAVEGMKEKQEEGSKDMGVTEMDTDTSRSEDIDADMETESNIESKEIDTDINEKDDNKSDRETISAKEHENVADMIEEEEDSGTKTEETDDNKDIQNDAEVSGVCDEIIDDNGDKSVDSDEKGGKSEVSDETGEHKEEKVVNLEEKNKAREADKTKTEQNIENEEIVDKGKDETKPERKEEERKTTQETSIMSDDQSSSKGSSQGCHGNKQGDHHGDSQSTSSSSHDRHRQDHDKHRHDDRSRDNRSRDDRSRDNRSHGSHRSDSHHGNKSSSYDRNRDRPYDRDNRGHGDYRSGYGYHGNQDHSHREQSQGGGYRGQPGQYGGHHGNQNRGGYNKDQDNRGYNRNYNNRGGYNQNYRGGYRGGRGGYY